MSLCLGFLWVELHVFSSLVQDGHVGQGWSESQRQPEQVGFPGTCFRLAAERQQLQQLASAGVIQ